MLGAIQTTRTNTSETQPSSSEHIHESKSLPNLESSKTPQSPRLTRATLSETDIKGPSKETKKVRFFTPASLTTAKLFLESLRSTVGNLRSGQTGSASAVKLDQPRFKAQLSERFKSKVKLLPDSEKPQFLRNDSKLSTSETATTLTDSLYGVLTPIIDELYERPGSSDPSNRGTEPLHSDALEMLKVHIEENNKTIHLSLAGHLEENHPELLDSEAGRTPTKSGPPKRWTTNQVKQAKISDHQATVHNTNFRLDQYDLIPQAGHHIVVQKKTTVGGLPATITATEKVPRLDPDVVSAHLVNTAMTKFTKGQDNATQEERDKHLETLKSSKSSEYVKTKYPKLFEKKSGISNSIQRANAFFRKVSGKNPDIKTDDKQKRS